MSSCVGCIVQRGHLLLVLANRQYPNQQQHHKHQQSYYRDGHHVQLMNKLYPLQTKKQHSIILQATNVTISFSKCGKDDSFSRRISDFQNTLPLVIEVLFPYRNNEIKISTSRCIIDDDSVSFCLLQICYNKT